MNQTTVERSGNEAIYHLDDSMETWGVPVGEGVIEVTYFTEVEAKQNRIDAGLNADEIEDTLHRTLAQINITQPLNESGRLLALLYTAYKSKVLLTQKEVAPILEKGNIGSVVREIAKDQKIALVCPLYDRDGENVMGFRLGGPEDYIRAEAVLYSMAESRL